MKIPNLTTVRLTKRLAISFGSLTLWAAVLSVIGWWAVTAIDREMDHTIAEATKARIAQSVIHDLDDLYLNLWNVTAHKAGAEQQARSAEVAKRRADYRKKLDQLEAGAETQVEKQLLEKVEAALSLGKEVNVRVVELASKGNNEQSIALCVSEGADRRREIDEALAQYVSYREQLMINAESAESALVHWARKIILGCAVVAVLIASFFGFRVARSITRPINEVVESLNRISKGDLTQDIPEALRNRPDEAGDLARAIHTMSKRLRELMIELSQGVQTLAAASAELSTVSSQSAASVRATSEKSSTVAAASEEMSANSVSVAAGMEQATANLTTVASATEEMTATIGEIAANSERARTITADATQQAQRVTASMRELSQAAQAIGIVTETITTISEQTKLLALNATIEAARAGAAGKGFAVVAHEIKELARQTAEATEDIKAKVGGIQTSTTGTLDGLGRISEVIGLVNEIVNTIATAIEEQSGVTRDIASNVSEAATGVKDANERVAQISTVSQTVAKDIATVNQAAGDISSGSELVLTSAAELSRLADNLQRMVGRFKVSEGTATTARTRPAGQTNSRGGSGVPPAGGGAQRPFIEWNEDLSVGVAAMDAHHKKLVDLINQLHSAMRSGQGRAAVGPALDELAKYATYHFSAEEKLMKQHKCAALPEQQDAHSKLVAVVNELRQKLAAGQQGLGIEVLTMLKDWLVSHIQRKDKPCMSALCEAARKRNPAGNGNGAGELHGVLIEPYS
jgi:methyl-accepting chemotaxis protein